MVKKVIHMYKAQQEIKPEDYDHSQYMRMFRIYRAITLLAQKDDSWLYDGKMHKVDSDELKQLFSNSK